MSADNLTAVMAAAMGRMDHDMMAPATGDADRDFVTIMIPHHQGAVEMAEAELRQEIAVMRKAIAALLAVPAATLTPMHMHKDH